MVYFFHCVDVNTIAFLFLMFQEAQIRCIFWLVGYLAKSFSIFPFWIT